jgi:hypothetical protein
MTTTDPQVCGYKMGTVWTKPRECGKPAKARTNSLSTSNGLLCGVHVRSVQSRGPVGTTITRFKSQPARTGYRLVADNGQPINEETPR